MRIFLILLTVLTLLFTACNDDAKGTGKAALALPEYGKEEEPSEAFKREQLVMAAVSKSILVFSGEVTKIDSSIKGENRASIYLIDVKPSKIWKGPLDLGSVAYISRYIPQRKQGKYPVFFLSAMDSLQVFSGKLRWQLTEGIPEIKEEEVAKLVMVKDTVTATDTIP